MDVWISTGELIGDALQDNPDLTEDEIREDNRIWFMNKRSGIYKELENLKIIPDISLKTLIPCMRRRGVI